MLPQHKQQKSGPWLHTSSSSSAGRRDHGAFVRHWGTHKAGAADEPFESGIVTVGLARLRLSAKFYLIAVFFVIFDVEAVFLFAWAVAFRELGWPGYIEAVIFIAILVRPSLIYGGWEPWIRGPPGIRPAGLPKIKESKPCGGL